MHMRVDYSTRGIMKDANMLFCSNHRRRIVHLSTSVPQMTRYIQWMWWSTPPSFCLYFLSLQIMFHIQYRESYCTRKIVQFSLFLMLISFRKHVFQSMRWTSVQLTPCMIFDYRLPGSRGQQWIKWWKCWKGDKVFHLLPWTSFQYDSGTYGSVNASVWPPRHSMHGGASNGQGFVTLM